MNDDAATVRLGWNDARLAHPASGPGTGTRTFTMMASVRDEEQRVARAIAAEDPPTVLVIEDDEKLAQVIARMLRRAGFRPVLAATGDDALKAMLNDPPCGAVIDVMIPHPDGLELCHQFRRDGWNGPIVVISALTSPELRARAIGAGADRFLAKPFRLGELVATLEHIDPRGSAHHERDSAPDVNVGDTITAVGTATGIDVAATRIIDAGNDPAASRGTPGSGTTPPAASTATVPAGRGARVREGPPTEPDLRAQPADRTSMFRDAETGPTPRTRSRCR